MSKKDSFLGFPPPLLGAEPVRLPILWDNGTTLALYKPPGILVLEDNWYPTVPVLAAAIGYQAKQQKPEFQRLNIPEDGLVAIYSLDPEVSGVVLFTRGMESAQKLKNDLGAGKCTFRYHLVAEEAPHEEVLDCDLPLARHFTEKRMVVSNRTGKAAETRFNLLERIGGRYTLWQAEVNFPRRHQVALHAFERGIKVLGDTTYSNSHPLYLSRIKRHYVLGRKQEEEKPIHNSVSIHLAECELADGTRISSAPGKSFVGQLKQLRRYAKR